MRIILASASPRRRELLKQIGIDFEIMVSNVEEKVTATAPHEVVQELSRQKAEAVAEALEGGRSAVTGFRESTQSTAGQKVEGRSSRPTIIIGADTIVSCDGKILGKPADAEEAGRMLRLLSGRGHEVYTGVTLLYRSGQQADSAWEARAFHECTRVHFAPMTEEEIACYVATGDPLDKAGAYGIQGFCARYITGIEGDYNNVVGLPVGRLYREMKGWL